MPVLKATDSDDPEVVTRAVAILTKITTDDGVAFDALTTVATSDTSHAATAGHIVASWDVRSGNQARMQSKMNRLVQETRIELTEGGLGTAREKADQAHELNVTFELADVGMELLLSDIEFAELRLAARSGDAKAK